MKGILSVTVVFLGKHKLPFYIVVLTAFAIQGSLLLWSPTCSVAGVSLPCAAVLLLVAVRSDDVALNLLILRLAYWH